MDSVDDFKAVIGAWTDAVASSLQSLGVGLEAIAGNYELANRTEARLLALIGSSIQALGSNFFAITITKELNFRKTK
jgi:hypothetical protein